MIWPIVIIDFPLSLTIGLSSIWSTLFTGASMGLLYIFPLQFHSNSLKTILCTRHTPLSIKTNGKKLFT